MNTQRAAEIQVVLEGIRLPATRAELVDYARRWDPEAASELSHVPDRGYRSIDEVGETLMHVQPAVKPPQPGAPSESELPPGGDAYVEPHPAGGSVAAHLAVVQGSRR